MAHVRTLPKVLMLHGYTQNGTIFSKRVAAVRKACQEVCEMVFVDGPHVIEIPTINGEDLNRFDSTADSNVSSETDPSLIPRGWWKRKEVNGPDHQPRIIFEGFDESIRFMRKVIDEQGPFDACFGFSQGAALAAVLSSIVEQPNLHPAFSAPPLTDQKEFKAVILISGLKLDMPHIWYGKEHNVNRRLKTRSLHVIGRADTIISEEQSRLLASLYTNPRIELHEGSHFVPSKKNWRDFFSNYFKNIIQNDDESILPSPGTSSLDVAILSSHAKI